MPRAPVYWLVVQERFNDLVIATYGRGFYILDDVTALEQLTDSVRASAVQLFEPRPAYRFRTVSRPNLAPAGTARGKNGPAGAVLNYWLKDALPEPSPEKDKKEKKSPVEITILDAAGQKIRTLSGPGKAGVNRLVWDLRYEPTIEVRLRTTPSGNPHVWEEKRFRGKETRDVYYYGISALKNGPLVAPGTYTVRLTVNGQDAGVQNLVVRKDPNSAGSEADVEAATKLSLSIYRDTNTSAAMINRLEWTRKQIQDLRKMLTAEKAAATDVTSVDDLEKKVRAVEDRVLQPTLAEADQKSFRGPLQLYLAFLWLQAEVGPGAADVSGNADFPPTKPDLEVYDLLSKRLADARLAYDDLYAKGIPAFEEASKGRIRLLSVEEPPEPRPERPSEDEDDDDWTD